MARRINTGDDEWIEVNQAAENAIVQTAMQENQAFGDALVSYLQNSVGGE